MSFERRIIPYLSINANYGPECFIKDPYNFCSPEDVVKYHPLRKLDKFNIEEVVISKGKKIRVRNYYYLDCFGKNVIQQINYGCSASGVQNMIYADLGIQCIVDSYMLKISCEELLRKINFTLQKFKSNLKCNALTITTGCTEPYQKNSQIMKMNPVSSRALSDLNLEEILKPIVNQPVTISTINTTYALFLDNLDILIKNYGPIIITVRFLINQLIIEGEHYIIIDEILSEGIRIRDSFNGCSLTMKTDYFMKLVGTQLDFTTTSMKSANTTVFYLSPIIKSRNKIILSRSKL